jgi:hypothetical protein
MKCALELSVIKEKAEKQYSFEQMLLDEQCKIKHIDIVADTIEFCENVIGPALEECALNRKTPVFTMRGNFKKDRVGNLIFYPLVRNGSYANGTPSEMMDETRPYDMFTIKNYLENYCFTVSWKDEWYKRYNFGDIKGVKLTVTI